MHELKNRYIESIEDYLYPSEINNILKKVNSISFDKEKETNFYLDSNVDFYLIVNPDERECLTLNEQ